MGFAERLKHLRKERQMTQTELGKMLSLDKSTICLYESGKREPELSTVERLATLFNVSIDYLLGRTDDPTPPEKREAAGETLAAHRTDDPMADLPEEARRSLLEFQEFIFKKYGKKQNS